MKSTVKFSKNKSAKILNYEFGTRFQDFRKNNHFDLFSTQFSLEINFIRANFLIVCSRKTDTDQKKKFNIVSLLEFYINYQEKI